MGNIVQSTANCKTSTSNISNISQGKRKKPRIFDELEKENFMPRSLIHLCLDDVESEIIPIEKISIPQQEQAIKPIYQVIVPAPRSDLGSEIEDLWNKAVQEQSQQLTTTLAKKTVKQPLPDGSLYEGEWFKGTMNGFGIISKDNILIYEGEWKLGKKYGTGTQYFTQRSYDKLIPVCQISDPQYWRSYNGQFEDDQFQGEGILELINGSCVFGEFSKGQLHGYLTYECLINKQITRGIWTKGQFQSQ